MSLKTAIFIKSIIGTDEILEDGTPQIVLIGRSNVGKSSIINSLAGNKNLAIISSFPGRTQQINIYYMNKAAYLIDLPGYGFANVEKETWQKIQKMIAWYLFNSGYEFKKVIMVIDANIGPTEDDLDMFYNLQVANKDVLILANKVDKLKKSNYAKQLQKIKDIFPHHEVMPYSAKDKIGVGLLIDKLFN